MKRKKNLGVLVLALLTGFVMVACGSTGVPPFGKSCTTIALPSLCVGAVDASQTVIKKGDYEVYFSIDGGKEELVNEGMFGGQDNRVCIMSPSYPSGPETFTVRVKMGDKEGTKEVHVPHDGCHPKTQTVDVKLP